MSDRLEAFLRERPALPEAHVGFLRRAIAAVRDDDRILALAAAGSLVTGRADAFSDLDLVLPVEPEATESVMAERLAIAGRMGRLLAGFTGEHVGEPRLLICLYGSPLLHVDLKFVSLEDAGERSEEPVIVWQRDGRYAAALEHGAAAFPHPEAQWIEDRFWVWVHYGAGKIGRGELFEALDFLGFLRLQVLGPLSLHASGARPMGVRRVEERAVEHLPALRRTVAEYRPADVARALLEAVALYRRLRDRVADRALERRQEAEEEAVAYLEEITAGLPQADG